MDPRQEQRWSPEDPKNGRNYVKKDLIEGESVNRVNRLRREVFTKGERRRDQMADMRVRRCFTQKWDRRAGRAQVEENRGK